MARINLSLRQESDQVWRVLTDQGEHAGNLKRVGAVWKFKAIGYDATGGVMPGHGPLTHRHNMAFATLDEGLICRVLGKD